MGGLSRPYPCDETFTPVAQFIAEKYNPDGPAWKIRPKIIIHTANPAGAVRIAGHLEGFEIERKESVPVYRLETES